MQAQGRSIGIALLILYVYARWLVGGQHHAPAALPKGKTLGPHFNGDCLDLGVGRNRRRKSRPYRVRALNSPSCSEGHVAQWGTGGKFGQLKKETT